MSRQPGLLLVLIVLIVLIASSCTPQSAVTPAIAPPTRAAPPTAVPAPLPTRAAPPTAVPPPATAPATAPAAGATTYTSAALGIRFSYLPSQNGQTVKVLEQGDKIYVYQANMEPTAGQWVQVFRNPAGESLVAAIRRVIMPGHPAQDCQVVQVADPAGAGRAASGYEYAGIVVRRAPGEDEAAVLPRWRTCPQPYTVVGGIGYFQSDPLHPSKFLFLSIGQYAILAGDDQPWQETISFD